MKAQNNVTVQDQDGNSSKPLLATVFFTRKQVIEVNGKYAARFKKWYYFNWTYIGISLTWNDYNNGFVLVDTKEEACEKLKIRFAKVNVVNCC